MVEAEECFLDLTLIDEHEEIKVEDKSFTSESAYITNYRSNLNQVHH